MFSFLMTCSMFPFSYQGRSETIFRIDATRLQILLSLRFRSASYSLAHLSKPNDTKHDTEALHFHRKT